MNTETIRRFKAIRYSLVADFEKPEDIDDILAVLEAAQRYAEAQETWHGRRECTKANFERLRDSRVALLALIDLGGTK